MAIQKVTFCIKYLSFLLHRKKKLKTEEKNTYVYNDKNELKSMRKGLISHQGISRLMENKLQV